jgi:uncharacterized protein (TIGR02466 family)
MTSARQIFPLFSTPLYVNNLGSFAKPDLRQLEYTHLTPSGESFPFLSSVDKNVLDRPELGGLRALILGEVAFYAHNLFAVSRKAEFYITNSWVNIYGRGDQAGAHIHHNSLFSGVLYLQATDAGGEIVFHREAGSQIPFPSAIDPEVDAHNIYNCRSWGYQPKTNDICIFPSILSHSVQPNNSDEARWSLAFNVFVRGEFGAIHQLRLK